MIRIAISILNFKSAQTTIACVQSLLSSTGLASSGCQLDILVTDNASGSSDESQLQQSLAAIPNVRLQLNSENRGFAAGHNCNLKLIFEGATPDFVWLLNNDCLVEESALSTLIECSVKHPDVGIWGATLVESDGVTVQCAGGCFYNTWSSNYREYGKGKSITQIDQLQPALFSYVAGASLFFPVSTLLNGLCPVPLQKGGKCLAMPQWLNENFFLYFEELDLAKRLKPEYKMAWCREAIIQHAGGVSSGTDAGKRSMVAEYHSSLSALKFTRTYYPRRLWVMAPLRYMLKCVQLTLTGKYRLLGSLTRAYRDFWLN